MIKLTTKRKLTKPPICMLCDKPLKPILDPKEQKRWGGKRYFWECKNIDCIEMRKMRDAIEESWNKKGKNAKTS